MAAMLVVKTESARCHHSPLSSKYGTHETAKARLWRVKTVKATFWRFQVFFSFFNFFLSSISLESGMRDLEPVVVVQGLAHKKTPTP